VPQADDPERPKVFTEGSLDRVYGPWYLTASAPDRFAVLNVLMEITDGSWVRRREWVRDIVDARVFHIHAGAHLTVSILVYAEYPSYAVLVHIGRLGDA
jgi:hypothetical protein